MFFELYEQASQLDDWYNVIYKASETGIVDDDELEAAKVTMTTDQYDQEFECSWVANVPGAIYGKELQTSLTKS